MHEQINCNCNWQFTMPFFNHSSAFLWKPQPQVRSHKSAMKTTMGWKSGFWCFQGCYDKLQSHISTNLDMAIGTVVGVAAAQLLAIVFAFCLCRYNLWMRKQSWATWYHILHTHPTYKSSYWKQYLLQKNIYCISQYFVCFPEFLPLACKFSTPEWAPRVLHVFWFWQSKDAGKYL